MYHELHIHYFPYVLGSSFITIFTWKIKFRESKYFLLSPVGSKAWRWNSDLGLYDCRAEVCAHLVLFIGCKQRCQELNLFMFYSQVQVLRDCRSALLLLSVLWETGTLCLDALDSVLILTTAPPWSWLPKCSPNPCSLLPRPLSALLEHYVFPSLVSHWQVTISATNSVANPRVVQLRANTIFLLLYWQVFSPRFWLWHFHCLVCVCMCVLLKNLTKLQIRHMNGGLLNISDNVKKNLNSCQWSNYIWELL